MSTKTRTGPEDNEGETYLQYYLRKYSLWLSIFLSLFVLLDTIAMFVATQYPFIEMLLYFGILLALLIIIMDMLLWFEESTLWAIGIAIITGLIPEIQLMVYLARNNLSAGAFGIVIIILLWLLFQIILPFAIIIWKMVKRHSMEKNTKENESK